MTIEKEDLNECAGSRVEIFLSHCFTGLLHLDRDNDRDGELGGEWGRYVNTCYNNRINWIFSTTPMHWWWVIHNVVAGQHPCINIYVCCERTDVGTRIPSSAHSAVGVCCYWLDSLERDRRKRVGGL